MRAVGHPGCGKAFVAALERAFGERLRGDSGLIGPLRHALTDAIWFNECGDKVICDAIDAVELVAGLADSPLIDELDVVRQPPGGAGGTAEVTRAMQSQGWWWNVAFDGPWDAFDPASPFVAELEDAFGASVRADAAFAKRLWSAVAGVQWVRARNTDDDPLTADRAAYDGAAGRVLLCHLGGACDAWTDDDPPLAHVDEEIGRTLGARGWHWLYLA